MATIKITNLALDVLVGTYDHERLQKQKIYIDIAIDCDITQAAKTDDLSHAVDYEALSHKIIESTSTTNFYLIEALAQYIIDKTLEDPVINSASLKLRKPSAIKNAEHVEIILQESRSLSS